MNNLDYLKSVEAQLEQLLRVYPNTSACRSYFQDLYKAVKAHASAANLAPAEKHSFSVLLANIEEAALSPPPTTGFPGGSSVAL